MKKLLTLIGCAAALFHGGAHAAPVVIVPPIAGNSFNTAGLTGFGVTGADMVGMGVEMCFAVTGCENRTWSADGGNGSHFGASGEGWSIRASATGDTFDRPFRLFVNQGNNARLLQSFSLYGLGGGTVFDIVNTPPDLNTPLVTSNAQLLNSPGSGNGLPFTLESGGNNVASIGVTYFDQVLVGGILYNDLYLGMRVNFAMNTGFSGFTGELLFLTDTDRASGAITPFNAGPTPVPEPGTLALVALSLGALAAARRRRS